jgi:hypothetical protein
MGALSPAAVTDGSTWYLYFTRPFGQGNQAIYGLTSTDGMSFPGEPFLVMQTRPLDGGAFDELAIGQPFATGGLDEVGDLQIGLFFVGTSGKVVNAIGYAGSRDGVSFERGNNGKPVLDANSPSENGPGVLIGPAQAVMFFSQIRAGISSLAAATDP